MTSADVARTMYEQGMIDERKIMTFGVMDCPLGEFSCIAAIKGNALRIYLSDASMKIGTLRLELPICNLQITKTSAFFLKPRICFDYKGKHYTLSHFGNPKQFIADFLKEKEK